MMKNLNQLQHEKFCQSISLISLNRHELHGILHRFLLQKNSIKTSYSKQQEQDKKKIMEVCEYTLHL